MARNHPLTRPCPLCSSASGLLLADLHFAVFDDSAISGHSALVVCSTCGFAFYDTSSRQADFDRYYEQNAYYCTGTASGTGGLGERDLARFEKLCERISPLLPHRQVAIFDVGCAKGGLLKVLARNGYERLYGADMLPECVNHVREALGIPAEVGSALKLPFPEIQADVLIYSHVVEHVIDLSALVESARRKLNDDGILYVEVPDASRYGECSTHPYQDLYLEHVNHFSPTTLAALFTKGGFDVVLAGRYELDASTGGRVPCAWAIFRKGGAGRTGPDWELQRRLTSYLSRSGQHPVHKAFAALAQARTPLYLWGISQYALLMLGQTALGQCDIRGLVDKDPSKQRRTLLGWRIESPEILIGAGSESGVIITAPGYEKAITAELKTMGFRGIFLTSIGTKLRSEP